MTDFTDGSQIISVKEIRKISGVATAHLTDEQLVDTVKKLDIIAELFIAKKKKELKTTPMKQ